MTERRAGHAETRQVVIAGGGVAGLETLLALRELAGHMVAVTIVSPEREFLYRPVTVGEAFDRSAARAYDLSEILATRPADKLVWGAAARVYPDEHVVVSAEGALISYDALVVSTGAMAVEAIPGALTFRGRRDVLALRTMLDDLLGGGAHSIAFAIPSELVWPLPAYELAMMTAAHLRECGSDAKVSVVTPEHQPLSVFGPVATAAILPVLAALGVELVTGTAPVIARGETLVLEDGRELPAERIVAVPVLEGPRVAGLPADDAGFIPVDAHGRVHDCPDVYAAGDAAAFPGGDRIPAFALKQGGLATQQADAVAEALAADVGVPLTPRAFRPVLRGLLMTGGAPIYLRAEPVGPPSEPFGQAAKPATITGGARIASAAAAQPLWWPPAKIAGRYLAPFLATAGSRPLESPLSDRAAVGGPVAVRESELDDARNLSLLLADCDARWGDFRSAVAALDAASAAGGALPPEYEAKRRQWIAAMRR